MKTRQFLALPIVVCLLGCQTTSTINITTNVPDAFVVLEGKPIGNTPLTGLKVKNNTGSLYPIIIQKEGYETLQRNLQAETKWGSAVGAYMGYALCWLILPLPLLINAKYINGPVENHYFILEEKKQE
jgi:hypothetical protein